MNSINEIWNGILTLLKEDISQTALDTWFSSAELVDLDNNNAVICAGNDLAAQVIQQRFLPKLKTALRELFCAEYNIVIISGRAGKETYFEQKEGRRGLRTSPIPAFGFDQFIVNGTNEFAYKASRAVAVRPGDKRFNPLFIYGNSGTGKSHLLCSIGNDIHEHFPGKRIIYIKGADFTSKLVNAIKTQKTAQFREEFRNADVLLVDEVDFIAGKSATQEEYFNTFNALFEAGSQIVMTASCAPRDMALLDDRLRSRFEGGILADIQNADHDLRLAFVKQRAEEMNLGLHWDDLEKIASSQITSIRQLGGVLNNLNAYKNVLGYVPTENVNRALNAVADASGSNINPEKIITETARYFEVSENEIVSFSRARIPTRARRIAIYLMRTELKMRNDEIGRFFSRDSTSIMNCIVKIEAKIKEDSELKEALKHIMNKVKGAAA